MFIKKFRVHQRAKRLQRFQINPSKPGKVSKGT